MGKRDFEGNRKNGKTHGSQSSSNGNRHGRGHGRFNNERHKGNAARRIESNGWVNPLIEEGLRMQREKAQRAAEEQQQKEIMELADDTDPISSVSTQKHCGSLASAPVYPWMQPPSQQCHKDPLAAMVGSLPYALSFREQGLFSRTPFPWHLRTCLQNYSLFARSTVVADVSSFDCSGSPDFVYCPSLGAVLFTHNAFVIYSSPTSPPQIIPYRLSRSSTLTSGAAAVDPQGRAFMAALSRPQHDIPMETSQISSSSVRNRNSVYLANQWNDWDAISSSSSSSSLLVHQFPLPTGILCDMSSLVAFTPSVGHMLVSHCDGILRFSLEASEWEHYRFTKRKRSFDEVRLGGEKAYLSAICLDNYATSTDAANTCIVGTRNGYLHHLDFRVAFKEVGSFCARSMPYAIHQINAIPAGNPYTVLAADIANTIHMFDIRQLAAGPVIEVQKCNPRGAILQSGFALTADGSMLLTRYSDDIRSGPINLSLIDIHHGMNSASHSTIGDPWSLVLDGVGQYGSLLFARPTTTRSTDPLGGKIWAMQHYRSGSTPKIFSFT